jgi:hypothetical protein
MAELTYRDAIGRDVTQPMDILFTDVYADGGWAWRN